MPALGSTSYGGGPYAGSPVSNSPQVEINQGAFPTRIIEMAFGYGPNDTAPVWTNITGDVTGFSTKRGRQHILARFEAGSATVTLDNKSGRYSPFNTTGSYYGKIRPGTPLRIRALWGATTYPGFYGFVESWPLTWPAANDSSVSVTAIDATKFLNLKKATSILAYSSAVAADAPYLWYRMNEATGATGIASSGSAALTLPIHYRTGWPYVGAAPQVAYANPAFQADGALIADTDASIDLGAGGAAFGGVFGGTLPSSIGANGVVTVEAWYRSNQGAGTATIGGVTDSVGGGGVELEVDANGNASVKVAGGDFSSTVPINDGKWHHLVATATSSTVVLYVDGITATSVARGTDSFTITNVSVGAHTYGPDPAGIISFAVGRIDEFAVYRATLTATQVATHYVAGTTPRYGETTGARIVYLASYTGMPAAMQKIDTGQTVVQGATDNWLRDSILKNMQDQADTENGALFIDAAGNLTFFDRIHTSRSPYSSVSLVLGDSPAGGEEPYRLNNLAVPYDDQDIYNEIVVTPAGMAPQIAFDATSQTTYGKRTQSLAALSSSVSDAAGRASFELNTQKDSQPRIDSVVINPADDPTMLWGPVLGFDLLTRVELRRRPMDGTSSLFDQICLIEGIEHKVTKATWETTWRLSTTDATLIWVIDEPFAGRIVDGASQAPPVAIGY